MTPNSLDSDRGRSAPAHLAIRRSVLFSSIDKYLVQICSAITMAVMARALTPAETGLYLIAAGVVVMIESLRDFGVAAYIVQRTEVSRAVVRTAFTITMLLSLGLAGILYLSAPAFGRAFDEPNLSELLRIGIIGLLLLPIGAPVIGLLRRDLDFHRLAILNIAGAVTNTLITVALGFSGVGAASYIWGSIAGNVMAAGLAIRARPYLWQFRPSLAEWRSLAAFGTQSTAVIVLTMAFDLLPRFVLGRTLGADAVGIYGRALTICQLPDRAIVSALSPVVLPAFAAKLRQHGDLRAAYLRGITLITGVQWPILLTLALLADPLVAVLLGSQWHAAAPLTRILALGAMVLAPAFLTFPLLVAIGRVRDTVSISLIGLPPCAILLVAAAPFGLEVVAATLLVTAPWQIAVAFFHVRRALGLSWSEFRHAASLSLPLAFGAGSPPLLLIAWHGGFDVGIGMATLAVAAGGACWLFGALAVNHPLLSELGQLARMIGGRRTQVVARTT